LPRRETTAR